LIHFYKRFNHDDGKNLKIYLDGKTGYAIKA